MLCVNIDRTVVIGENSDKEAEVTKAPTLAPDQTP